MANVDARAAAVKAQPIPGQNNNPSVDPHRLINKNNFNYSVNGPSYSFDGIPGQNNNPRAPKDLAVGSFVSGHNNLNEQPTWTTCQQFSDHINCDGVTYRLDLNSQNFD